MLLSRHWFFTLCVTLTVFSSRGQIRYALKGGLVSSTRTLRGQTFYYAPGYLFGFISDMPLGKHFSFSPELYYSQKGNTIASGSVYRLNYLNLSVLGGYYITRKLQFLMGVNLGFLLNGKTNQGDTTYVTTGFYQRVDPGWDAGLRYKVGRWGIEVNFVRSLIGIEKSKQEFGYFSIGGLPQFTTVYIFESNKTNNQAFELSVYCVIGSGISK